MKLKDQYKYLDNQCRVLCECLLEEQQTELKRELEAFQKEQWEVKERMMYKEFNKFMKKTRITIHEISALSSLVRHKIIICLLRKFIIKSEKQWLENENYLFSEFLQRVRALKSQLQEKYNQYRLNLYSEQYISAENDKYIKLIISKEFLWFKNL